MAYRVHLLKDTLKLHRDIDLLGILARKLGMNFQPVKCNLMQLTRKLINVIQASYTLEGTVLENVENLGVTITFAFDRLESHAPFSGLIA